MLDLKLVPEARAQPSLQHTIVTACFLKVHGAEALCKINWLRLCRTGYNGFLN